MITVIGTGHVFDLAEPVAFIVQHTWPDAVLIELDKSRYDYLMNHQDAESRDPGKGASAMYRQASKYQDRVAQAHGAKVGGEFLAAVNMGRLQGAEIIPIDTNAMQVMNEVWEEMSLSEKMRYRLSGIGDLFRGGASAEATQARFARDEDAYMADMRRRYPTLVRKLIDERNAYMAEQINKAALTHSNMVVVVGDGHVEGICALLEDQTVRKIRLADLMDEERMNAVRRMVYNGDEKI